MVYTREELPLLFLSRVIPTFYEAHQLRRSYLFTRLIHKARGIIAITQGLKDALVREGLSEKQILVAHDGYDEKAFAIRMDKHEARKKLSLPQDRKIAMYIGGLEAWKGVETLLEASKSLVQNNILVAIIGGTGKEIRKLKPKYPNVLFLGARPYRELPVNQQAADILVVPNSGEYELSKSFTSPLKLFAYMASGIAFCAANVPALAEVITQEQAFIFPPDDSRGLADVIKRALSSKSFQQRLSKVQNAEKRVQDFTWDKRAKNVLAYIAWINKKGSS
jgi:glycosyltransferase involved in cell wall biosynthesis